LFLVRGFSSCGGWLVVPGLVVLVACGGWGLVVSGCFSGHALLGCPVRLGGSGGGVMGLLVENCIVDASILKRSNFYE
jgi:hypothetical protein